MKKLKVMNRHRSKDHSRPGPGCPRCEGMLVPTLLQVGPYDATVPSFPSAWRCINCGAILDWQIRMNRTATSHGPKPSKAQTGQQEKIHGPRCGPRLRVPLTSKG